MRPNSIHSQSIHINRGTTIDDFRVFANNLEKNSKLRGKLQKDGTYVLYVSHRSSGTGVKARIFDTPRIRRNTACIAIWQFANNVGANALALNMKDQMMNSGELDIARINNMLAASVPSEAAPSDRTLGEDFKSLNVRNGTVDKDNDEGLKETKPAAFNFFSDLKKYMNTGSAASGPLADKRLEELAKVWDKSMSSQSLFAGRSSNEANEIYAITKSFLDKEMNSPSAFPNGLEIFTAACVPERSASLALNELLVAARKGRLKEIEGLAKELKLEIWLQNIKTAAALFTNEAYLRKIPKDKRVKIGIAGSNMAKLAAIFEDPAGPYQSAARLAKYARENPAGFSQLVQKDLGPIEPPAVSKARGKALDNNASEEESQIQIEP